MKNILLLILSICLLASCKKADVRQFSEWYVDGTGHMSNNVALDLGHGRTDLKCNDQQNFWGITFNRGNLTAVYPEAGVYKITNGNSQNPEYAGVGIFVNDELYNCAYDLENELLATVVNGKAEYKMGLTKFKSYSDSTKTILVSGTFRDP